MKKERSPEWIVWVVHGICYVLLNILVLSAYRYQGLNYDQKEEAYFQFARIVLQFRPLSLLVLAGMGVSAAALAVITRGRKKGLDLWYTEPLILGIILAGFVMNWANDLLRYGFMARSFMDVVSGVILCGTMYWPILLGLLSLVRKGIRNTFFADCLVVRAATGLQESVRTRSDRIGSARGLLLQTGWSLLNILLAFLAGASVVGGDTKGGVVFLFLLLILNAWRLTAATQKRKQVLSVFERIADMAAGDVGHDLDTESFQGEVRWMAETVNTLDHSLERAVRERTQSERMKTELIANVSHDLRTPLTSVINYVDLIKRENVENPRVKEYVDVLESKALRMKGMAEALMEASRASSGNMKITWERIDMVQMLRQVYGEFQERMEERQLHVVLRLPEPPAYILADGKILWRVLDNLYTNVCKYARPGTRVLVELQETTQSLVYTMKNVSSVPLRYTSEELQERFIRGEDSRTTEGSGLGLSIARSMTEQLHGKFELYSDEEMFRVRLIFPLMEAEK